MDNSDLPKLCMRRPCNTVQFQRLKATSLRDHGNPTGVSRASAGGVQVASRDQLDSTWRLVQSLDRSLGRFDGGRAKNTVPCFQETDKILRSLRWYEIAVYLLWHNIYDYNQSSDWWLDRSTISFAKKMQTSCSIQTHTQLVMSYGY